MMIPREALHILCPMHAFLDRGGLIEQAGPTLHKLAAGPVEGRRFLDLFEVYRPRSVETMAQLLQTEGRKLHLRLRGGTRTQLKGHLVPNGAGGALVNLSFGIAVVEAVREFALTSTDFAPTDLAVEMLYLVEAKSAAMDASRRLNTRLQGAMIAAEERAFTDTLTGLRNRRAMDHVLMRLARTGGPFALMHLDLDHFKDVNDNLGHAAGDHVLTVAARIMQEETRKGDTVVRVGGDEFVIVISNAVTRARLADLARRLITRIERPIPYRGMECRISTSIGIALAHDGAEDPMRVLGDSDTALYAAKRAGRATFRFHDGASAAAAQDRRREAAGDRTDFPEEGLDPASASQ